jgi:hypothetical protein
MAQGKYKKLINKKVNKGHKGHPIATIALYGPTNNVASKIVCSIINHEGAEPEPMRKWTSKKDIRKSEKTMEEVLMFIQENDAKTVAMLDKIIGCPHEEGIDYPDGEACPDCKYWKNRNRFTDELLH